MRKQIKYYIVISTIAVAIFAAYFFAQNLSKNSMARTASLVSVSKNVNGINVMVDPRIELLAAVQSISGYDEKFDLITNEDFTYKKEMNNYFSSFSNHETVKVFDNMSSAGFSFDAPPATMLYLSNPLSLDIKYEFTDYLRSRAGAATLEEFALKIRKFAIDTKFDEFYNKHKDFYNSVVERNSEVMKSTNYIAILEQYYGMKQNSYNIILSPMLHRGGFGPRLKDEKGVYDIYSIQGTASIVDDIPIFGSENEFTYIVFHEFSHSFVNPLTEQHIDEVNKYSKLFKPIYEKMVNQAYVEWGHCVNEHIVRAVVARITAIHYSKETYDSIIYEEKKKGFFYIEALTKKLEEFENNQDKYKTFKEFYPELIKVFKELSEKELGEEFYKI
jgi:hypothetical protein